MRVFKSWAKPQSRAVARLLRDWFPFVINAIQPWMSEEDIDKGARWNANIAEELEGSNFGIICLTPENLESSWLNFEAGALSKTVDKHSSAHFCFVLRNRI